MKKWDNRIVRYGIESADQLLANEQNFRIHPMQQQDYMLASLNDVGWVQDVIINLRTSEEWPAGQRNVQTLVDGHLRVKLALRHDIKEIPVKYVDLTPRQEALVLATLDAITEKAEIDPAMLNMLLEDVNTTEPALQELLAQMAEDAGVFRVGESDIPSLPSGDKVEFQQMTFTLHDNQAETVKAAMLKAKSDGHGTSDINQNSNGNALAWIAEVYIRG